MQGTKSEARLTQRQMMMIANGRYSGSASNIPVMFVLPPSIFVRVKSPQKYHDSFLAMNVRKVRTIMTCLRSSGEQPLRPHLLKEYAVALEWAEASLNMNSDDFAGKNTYHHASHNLIIMITLSGDNKNNTITDGGSTAPPELLL